MKYGILYKSISTSWKEGAKSRKRKDAIDCMLGENRKMGFKESMRYAQKDRGKHYFRFRLRKQFQFKEQGETYYTH